MCQIFLLNDHFRIYSKRNTLIWLLDVIKNVFFTIMLKNLVGGIVSFQDIGLFKYGIKK